MKYTAQLTTQKQLTLTQSTPTHSIAMTLHSNTTRASTENSTGEFETDIRLMMKIGGYGQHLQKENVLEEPGLVTGR